MHFDLSREKHAEKQLLYIQQAGKSNELLFFY